MKKNKNKGFSLVELIVCVAILAIFTAFLIPSYINLREESKAKKDATKLESVCTAFKAAMSEPEVDKEAEQIGGGASLAVISEINGNGVIDFGKSELIGVSSSTLENSKLWLNSYQSIGKSYEMESTDYAGQYVIFYIKPKTETTTASCEYIIAETKPTLQSCTLQLGTYSDKESANTLVRKLLKDGFSARVENSGTEFIVYVGSFMSIQDAKIVEAELTNSGYAAAIVLLD